MTRKIHPKGLWWLAAALVLIAAGMAGLRFRGGDRGEVGREPSEYAEGGTSEYAGAGSCQPCHPAIAASYAKHGMARSFYKPTPENIGRLETASYHHVPSGRHYAMLWRDGRLFQRRWQQDANGGKSNVFEMEAHYVVGSGNHARTFLHRSGNGEITELPLSWYAEGRTWRMSPGFDKPKHFDFARRIDHGCMFCHNSYPAVEAGEDRFGRVAAFPAELPLGIDCQRCHAPGAKHVALAKAGNDRESIRAAIVNPSRLSPSLQMDVCLQCHLETTSEPLPSGTRRAGRSAYSYRPGQPLSGYMVHFDHPPGTGHDDKFEIAGGAYRLRMSACFLKSQGRLTCTSCHDPHDVARGEAAAAHYNERCRECHQTAHPDRAMPGCVDCHMPKRRTDDAVHVVMTDHRIQRRQPSRDLLAPLSEKAVAYKGDIVFYFPETLHEADRETYLGVALAAHGADTARGIALLERAALRGGEAAQPKIWAALGDARMAQGNLKGAADAYLKALAADQGLEKARYNCAQAFERMGDLAAAEREYRRLIAERSGFAEAHMSLADLLARSGRVDQAAAEYQLAIQARAAYAEPYNGLGAIRLAQGRTTESREALETALRIDPENAGAHNNLARLLAAQGQPGQALASARRAVNLDPENAEMRLNLGRLLYALGEHRAATVEFERIARTKPDFAEARLSLGIAYGEAGRLDAAIGEFQEALRIHPGHAEARKNLELAIELRAGGQR